MLDPAAICVRPASTIVREYSSGVAERAARSASPTSRAMAAALSTPLQHDSAPRVLRALRALCGYSVGRASTSRSVSTSTSAHRQSVGHLRPLAPLVSIARGRVADAPCPPSPLSRRAREGNAQEAYTTILASPFASHDCWYCHAYRGNRQQQSVIRAGMLVRKRTQRLHLPAGSTAHELPVEHEKRQRKRG